MFADLKNDFVFRRVFANHPDLTQTLLNDLLGLVGERRIASLALLSPEQAPLVAGSKLSILDLKAKDETGRTFVVEVQLLHVTGFLNRVVYNACKTYVAPLPTGGDYANLHDVVALSICNFELWPDNTTPGQVPVPLVSLWSMREAVSGREGLTQVQYAFVELPKVDRLRKPPEERTPAETWAWLFRSAVGMTAMPDGLSTAQVDAMKLAEEATFSFAEAEAYRRTADEIAQAEQLLREGEARGEARGEVRGEARGRTGGLADGEARGLADGEAKGLRHAVLDMCEVLAIAPTVEQRAALDAMTVAALTVLRAAIKTGRAWPAA